MTTRRCALSIGLAVLLGGCGTAQPVTPSVGVTAFLGVKASPAHAQGPCVYLLGTTAASDLSHMRLTAPNCYVYINDTANMSYSTIKAAKILYAGTVPNETGARFPEATPAPALVISDPCPTIRGCAYLLKHPPATSGCSPGYFYKGGQTIGGPGQVTCFSDLTISGSNQTICGLIEITGSQLHVNNSSVSSCSSGVTFALSSNTDDTNFSSATLTLSPPGAGKYKGVLFYRVASQSAGIDFSTCTCNFAGVLYFPKTTVNYAHSGGKYQLLIFGQANFSNAANLRLGNPP